MPIQQITTSNTFAQWLSTTQALVENQNYYEQNLNVVINTANTVANVYLVNAASVYSNTVNVFINTTAVYSNTVNVYNNTVVVFRNTENVYSNTVVTYNELRSYVSSAYDSANAAAIISQNAYDTANLAIVASNTAASNLIAVLAYQRANDAFDLASRGNVHAQAAFNRANVSAIGSGSTSLLGNTSLNSAIFSGMYRFDVPSANTPGFNYGQLLVMRGGSGSSNNTITQIAGDFSTGSLATRSGNPSEVGGDGSWTSWQTILDSNNYNTYAPTLSGTGATGTWGINVTGSSNRWATSRTLTLAGGASGSVSFDGSANVSLSTNITPSFLGTNQSLTTSTPPPSPDPVGQGYQVLPGGLTFIWGYFTSTSDGDQTILFHRVFPTLCVFVWTDYRNDRQNNDGNPVPTGGALGITRTSFIFNRNDNISGATTIVRYFAIGY